MARGRLGHRRPHKPNAPTNAFLGIPAHNVLDYGAVGDSSHSSGGGTDDTAAIQNALNAAVVDGVGMGCVAIPGNRTYRITSKLSIPAGIEFVGIGGRNGAGNQVQPTLVWDGAAGGIIAEVALDLQNIQGTAIRNICFAGRVDLTNLPSIGLRFGGANGNTAYLDAGTYVEECAFQVINGHGIYIQNGCTNFHIIGGRWDGCTGSGVKVGYEHANGSPCNMTIYGEPTWTGSADLNSDNFMFLDGEANRGNSRVTIIGLHAEISGSLNETYAGGANPYDRRGLIRLGVSTSYTAVQHHIRCIGLDCDPANVASYSTFQITASTGTDLENARMVNIMVFGGGGLSQGTSESSTSGQVRFIGGRVPAVEKHPTPASFANGNVSFSLGRNSAGAEMTSWHNSRSNILKNPITQPMAVSQLLNIATDWPKDGMRSYVTDASTNTFGSAVSSGGTYRVPVFYDEGAAAWRIG